MPNNITIFIVAVVIGIGIKYIGDYNSYQPVVQVIHNNCVGIISSPKHVKFCTDLSDAINNSGYGSVNFTTQDVSY